MHARDPLGERKMLEDDQGQYVHLHYAADGQPDVTDAIPNRGDRPASPPGSDLDLVQFMRG